MNYSKQSVRRHKSGRSKTQRSARKKFGLTVLKSILVLILVLIAVGLGGFAYYAKEQIKDLPDISEVNISPSGFQTKIVDSDGNQIETLAASGANRDYVSLSEIPLDLQHAFVAIEDSRFYEHNGVDVKGIIRAAFTGLANGGHFSQGASTITQQLLKNNFFTGWTEENGLKSKLKRKIQEQYLALELEKVTSKDTILENYLNTINLGQNTLGVEAAAQRYFNKDTNELTLSEDAVIAGITQNPARYNPITHPEYNAQRREKVLGNMLEQGYITKSQYKEAMDDDVYDRIKVVNNDLDSSSTSYFVDALTQQVMKDLMEKKGISETEAYMKLYSGGLTIHATQDPTVQKIANKEVNNKANYGYEPSYSFSFRLTVNKADGTQENYSEHTMLAHYQAKNPDYSINYSSKANAKAAYKKYKSEVVKDGDTIPEGGENIIYTPQPQVAMTIMDQSTGQVKAIVGGRGKKKGSRTLNRVTDITRQPGSTFKILAAYAPALDAGNMTLATVQDDAPTSYTNGRPIRNGGRYRGFTNIRTAITHSINVVAVKTLTAIGTGLGYQYVQDFGITTLDEGDNNQALALGGISRGVKNIELAGAYATIANHGTYHRPIFYTTVEDNNGEVLLDTTKDEGKKVIKESTAFLLTSAMQDVMTKGTGIRANFSGMAVAGKSGTTTKNRDCLFAGFTPYYTCVIWGGYDDNAPQNQYQTYYPKNIWRAVMSQINQGKENPGFAVPKDVVRKAVCAKSGLLPEEGICNMDPRGSQVYTEYFTRGTVPTKTCDHHVKLTICKSSNLPAGEFCPENEVTEKVFIIGGSSGTEDSPYAISSKDMKSTCNLHTEKTREEEEEKEKEKKKKQKEKQRKKKEKEEQSSEEETTEE